MSTLNVTVAGVEQVTPLVKHFTLVRDDGSLFPAFSGGSHIVVAMNINGRIHRNPYSLMGSPEETGAYHISVRRQEKSRGGSVHMHDRVRVGSRLQITYPVNLFALEKRAKKHVLIAGGIGITPFMSQIEDLNRTGGDYELHYAFRSPEHGAFRADLQARCGNRARFYVESEGAMLNLQELLGKQPLGTHTYVCGPHAMVVAMIETARELGWPEGHIHSEQFSAPPSGDAFRLKLSKSDIEIVVPSELSMLEAIEAAGVDAPYLCRGGACGRCELEVLNADGPIVHNDHYLTDAEKAAGKKIMPCVSRAKCNLLEVNL
ncbi:vanillate monooxygenase ferredoxin subunit [Methylophilaceae bacterium]|nr:vanillate monooxygenase ferredoxin subunit [Methylophilaceae bacterium]